jgi:hypothetical protein
MDQDATRRDLLLPSVLAATLPLGLPLRPSAASTSPINPAETIVRLPGRPRLEAQFQQSAAQLGFVCAHGRAHRTGPLLHAGRWWPGYMTAPHTYASDRFCMVLSGTWWCNSGNDFDPRFLRARGSRQLRAPGRRHTALRRRNSQPQPAGDHRNLRHGTGQLQAGRAVKARLARRVSEADAYCCVDPAAPWPDSRLLSPSR